MDKIPASGLNLNITQELYDSLTADQQLVIAELILITETNKLSQLTFAVSRVQSNVTAATALKTTLQKSISAAAAPVISENVDAQSS